jgi:hypothetical protein
VPVAISSEGTSAFQTRVPLGPEAPTVLPSGNSSRASAVVPRVAAISK